MPPHITRFLRYVVVGSSTFLLDLSLLYVFTDYLRVNYILAAGMSFAVAVSLNYVLSRRYVFHGSDKDWKTGYLHFLYIASAGVVLVMGGMYLLIGLLQLSYLLARVIVAGVTGMWNYLLNLFVNFDVAGKHDRVSATSGRQPE